MINKYTVQFIDKEFEKLYQAQKYQQQAFPLILWVCAGLTLISCIGVIEGIVQGDYNYAGLRIITIGVCFFIVFLMRKKPAMTKVSIFIAINYSLLYQLSLANNMDSQYGYLMGSNVMMVNLSFLLVCDFIDGSINNILMFSSRITLAIVYQDTPYRQGYQFTTLMFLITLVGLYKYNYDKRIQFYLCHKDSEWVKMLPRVTQSPFILFNYNAEQIKFQTTISNMEGDQNHALCQVLRNHYHQGITLESFIHKRIQNNTTDVHTQQLQLLCDNQPILIKYSEFHIVEQMFLVVFPTECLKQLQDQVSKISNHYVHLTISLMNRMEKQLFSFIKRRDWKNIIQLYSNIIEKKNRVICKYSDQFVVEEFNFTQMILQMNAIHKNKFSINLPADIVLRSIKPYFQLFLNLITRASVQHSKIIIKFLFPNLRIIGWIDVITLEQDPLFKQTCSILFSEVETIGNGYNFQINDNPNLSFNFAQRFIQF